MPQRHEPQHQHRKYWLGMTTNHLVIGETVILLTLYLHR